MKEKKNDSVEKTQYKELRKLNPKQIIIYTLPMTAYTAIFGLLVFFVLIFYINIMGLPPIIVGGIYSIGLVLYAIMVPIFGVLSDKINSKIGRKKTIMIIVGPLFALIFVLFWIPPKPLSNIRYGQIYLPILIWLAIFMLLFRLMDAAYTSSYMSLLPELSTDEQNRVEISMMSMLMSIVGTAIGMLGPILMMGRSTENLSRDNPEFYYPESETGQIIYEQIFLLALFISLLFIVLFIIMMIFIKEPKIEMKGEISVKSVFRDLAIPFKDKNFRNWLFTYYFFWISLISLQYLILNLATFVLELRGIFEYLLFAEVALIVSILSFFVWKSISKKIGIKSTLNLCLIIECITYIFYIIILIDISHEFMLIIGLILLSTSLFGMIGAMIFPMAIMSDIIDTAELETGKKLSGSYTGAYFMTSSLAGATSMFFITLFLEIFGAESRFSYIIIFITGAFILLISILILKKVIVVGTEHRTK
ncbi:MAG: MFS transporter [Promethearchaeota archaeon]